MTFQKELNKGPYTYDMKEKAYWEALAGFAVDQFRDTPGELELQLENLRHTRSWFSLGKFAKNRPDTKEAAGYAMLDDAFRMSESRFSMQSLSSIKQNCSTMPRHARFTIRQKRVSLQLQI